LPATPDCTSRSATTSIGFYQRVLDDVDALITAVGLKVAA
jgi:hypothetical protein